MKVKENQEKFNTQKPKKSFLREYISYYYFHNSLDDSFVKSYVYYPHIKSALTIYKNSKALYSINHSITIPDQNTAYSFLYSGIQTQLRSAGIVAPFNKIGVVFNELGINHFIKEPISSISNDPIDKSFNYFGDELIKTCELVYKEEEIDKKVDYLDSFFEKAFCNFMDEKFKNCIEIVVNSKEKLTVTELSEKAGINKKTLLRLFKKHIGCTPKDYLKIAQFRKSLNDFLLENKTVQLTELALDNQYYDQSQFINHFKKLSGVNPKAFFKDIKHIGTEDIFWTLK